MDDLARLAPPNPGLAEATVIAPERKASPLPSPTSEFSSPGFRTPNIIVSQGGEAERPQSPETLIPATDTLSTRPTRGGVAYPFRLKVDGKEDGDVNASTLTLQSVSVASPSTEEFDKGDKELGGLDREGSEQIEKEEKEDRPSVERFITTRVGELRGDAEKGGNTAARPGVERFETAQEDLNTLANGKA